MIKIVDDEFLHNRSYENEILNDITKANIFATLRKHGFDPENLLYTKKMTFKLARKFNAALRKTCIAMALAIKMHEIILLLEEEYTTINFLLMVLDEKNKQIIRNECIHKYNINDDDCILFEILSW